MARIKPFRGLRPSTELCEKVASPPYDVLNSAEAREMCKDNPYSFLHIIKPEVDLPEGTNLYDESVYQMGKDNMDKFRKENILVQDEMECFYVYRQIMGNHEQVGLVAGASTVDYKNDIIKKHEHTRPDKEDDRTKHVSTLNANTGPVFLTYHAKDSVNAIISKIMEDAPLYDFASDDGIKHTLWKVEDKGINSKIVEEFANIEILYVADGHHRSASAGRVADMREKANPNHTGEEEYNFFLTVIFPHDQMYIMDYNRVVKDLNGNSKEEFLAKVKENFDLEEFVCADKDAEEYKPTELHTFTMYLDAKWYKLTAKKESYDANDPVKSLDVAILQDNLLHPILAIEDPRLDNRISFVGGIRGLKELKKHVDSGKFEVAFALFPTSIEELISVADAGKIMPPKSTWFEPKLRSGLITHLLED